MSTVQKAVKYQVKVFARDAKSVDPDGVVPVFHAWIRDKRVQDELLIDVADYTHVPEGPGVVLIGHESDYFVDEGEGRPGLLYARKRGFDGDVEARLTDAFVRALRACRYLEGEPKLGLRFGTAELLFRIADRLNAPNEPATYETVEPALRKVLGKLLGGRKVTLERPKDQREPFTLRIRADGDEDVGTVLGRL